MEVEDKHEGSDGKERQEETEKAPPSPEQLPKGTASHGHPPPSLPSIASGLGSPGREEGGQGVFPSISPWLGGGLCPSAIGSPG